MPRTSCGMCYYSLMARNHKSIDDLIEDLRTSDSLDGLVSTIRRTRLLISDINSQACAEGNTKVNVACGRLQDELRDMLLSVHEFPRQASITLGFALNGLNHPLEDEND